MSGLSPPSADSSEPSWVAVGRRSKQKGKKAPARLATGAPLGESAAEALFTVSFTTPKSMLGVNLDPLGRGSLFNFHSVVVVRGFSIRF